MPNDDEPRDEAITQPDLQLLTCPGCRGEGKVMKLVEIGPRHSAKPERCGVCGGLKKIDRLAFAKWHAQRQGRG